MRYMRTLLMTAHHGPHDFRMTMTKQVRIRDPLHARESCRKLSTYYE